MQRNAPPFLLCNAPDTPSQRSAVSQCRAIGECHATLGGAVGPAMFGPRQPFFWGNSAQIGVGDSGACW